MIYHLILNSKISSQKNEFCEQVLTSLSENGERQLLMSIPLLACLKSKKYTNDYYRLKDQLNEFATLLSFKPIASSFIDSPKFVGEDYRMGNQYQSEHFLGSIFSITPLRSTDAHYFEKLHSTKQTMGDVMLQKNTIDSELKFCSVYI